MMTKSGSHSHLRGIVYYIQSNKKETKRKMATAILLGGF